MDSMGEKTGSLTPACLVMPFFLVSPHHHAGLRSRPALCSSRVGGRPCFLSEPETVVKSDEAILQNKLTNLNNLDPEQGELAIELHLHCLVPRWIPVSKKHTTKTLHQLL